MMGFFLFQHWSRELYLNSSNKTINNCSKVILLSNEMSIRPFAHTTGTYSEYHFKDSAKKQQLNKSRMKLIVLGKEWFLLLVRQSVLLNEAFQNKLVINLLQFISIICVWRCVHCLSFACVYIVISSKWKSCTWFQHTSSNLFVYHPGKI